MKMIRKRFLSYLMAVAMIFSVGSCDLLELDINTDPNNPSTASLSLLLTNAQVNLASTFAGGLNNMAHGFMGITSSTDDFDMTNNTWNGTWNGLYSGPLTDLERLIEAAEAQGNNPRYLGIGRVLKAYYFSLMVDLWGDVPYSEAFKGSAGIKEPKYDTDSEIYADLLNLIDQAIANFAESSAITVVGDVMYSGSIPAWNRAAHSLKLKLLIQTRRVNPTAAADIQAVITADSYIKTAAQDFQFRFSRLQNPDNRHPWYQNGYAGGEAGFSYFGHQYMFEMLNNRDPRTPYYFKRQTTQVLDPADPSEKQTIPCSQRDDCIYSYFVANPTITNAIFGVNPDGLTSSQRSFLAGWFGRDRSDPSGIPNDNPLRTTVGAYPAAGLFDDVAELGGNNKGSGDGIFPMITSWMVKFYLAEAMITLGVTVPAETQTSLLQKALTEQLAKVVSVGTAADPAGVAAGGPWPITYKTSAAFVAEVVAGYPAAGNENQKLQYLMKQAWFANFGNGFEIYNAFRRTGFPNDIQSPLQIPRQFALRLPYAQDELNLNRKTPTVVYDSPADAIFWDVIKFQF
ncbi:MAG TPA: SusD/RagB family nutrient-binding outer membrane lipoprotein [Cyclobacteriaceae bacterium]|nr:SusD/RagB family nutrient-binding outer membrane lipoprotein [Cyclobacteriaceae bacterium]